MMLFIVFLFIAIAYVSWQGGSDFAMYLWCAVR